jgi:putative salt-induced outer membrane protein YdiY
VKRLSLFLTVWLAAGYVSADVVVLTNGDRLTGTVDSISGGHVLLSTDYAGHVPIKLDAIAELTTEASFNVRTEQGRVVGKFMATDGAQTVVSEDISTDVALASVKTAGQDKLALATFAPEWTTRADLAAKISNGNTDTEQFTTLFETKLKQETVEHSLSLLITSEVAEEEKTKDEFDLDYGYKRFISEKWYASGNGEYYEDPLKDVDSRITVGAGLGYQFWDDSFGSFSTDLGLSYVREDLAGETENNPAVRWGLEYKRYLLSKKLEGFHKQSVLFIPDSDRGEVIESSTGLRYALNSRIDATARVDVDHETKPAPGNSKTDVTYNLGIGIRF